MAKIDDLTEMLRPAVEAAGCELLGIEYIAQGKHSVLRIYIDHPDGINVDDCAKVSHQASGILEVEDPIASQYTLEVSSPGSDRPLFALAHYQPYLGSVINIRCNVGVNGRRKFKGTLKQIDNDMITVEVDGKDYLIDFHDIDKANLVAAY